MLHRQPNMTENSPINKIEVDISSYSIKKCEKATSQVWKYFLQYQICHNRDYAVCRLCNEEEKSKIAGDIITLNYERYEVKYCHSTTKLSRHLQTHHKVIFEELLQIRE
jgi:hypothetical protein